MITCFQRGLELFIYFFYFINSRVKTFIKEKIIRKISRVFPRTLVLELNCYYGDNIQYEVLSKQLFQRKQLHGG